MIYTLNTPRMYTLFLLFPQIALYWIQNVYKKNTRSEFTTKLNSTSNLLHTSIYKLVIQYLAPPLVNPHICVTVLPRAN